VLLAESAPELQRPPAREAKNRGHPQDCCTSAAAVNRANKSDLCIILHTLSLIVLCTPSYKISPPLSMSDTPNPSTVSLRNPSPHTIPAAKAVSSTLSPPTPEWLTGTWHVTHSTLPMWKSKSNVRITYTPLPAHTDAPTDFDDLVEYKKLTGGKDSSVHGVSRAVTVPELGAGWAFSWRGKGLLMIASSQWEILGWGEDAATGSSWVVTYFGKTLFTPAGLDFYSRSKDGLSEGIVTSIKAELAKLEDSSLKTLAASVFDVPTSPMKA
jgi:hypothetical protein